MEPYPIQSTEDQVNELQEMLEKQLGDDDEEDGSEELATPPFIPPQFQNILPAAFRKP